MKRTALVTGSSRGIGRAIALELAASGHRVVVTCLKETSRAEEVAEQIRTAGGEALAVAADVTKNEQVRELADRIEKEFGGVDVLVNNAGDRVLDTDLKGAFRVTKALLRGMLHKNWGRIINIVSVSGIAGHPGQANYSAAKGGLIAMTKALALELATRGITANAVAPGLIDTEIIAHLKEDARKEFLGRIPMARFGTPEEIAAVVSFLASDRASYITGQVWRVDGGMA